MNTKFFVVLCTTLLLSMQLLAAPSDRGRDPGAGSGGPGGGVSGPTGSPSAGATGGGVKRPTGGSGARGPSSGAKGPTGGPGARGPSGARGPTAGPGARGPSGSVRRPISSPGRQHRTGPRGGVVVVRPHGHRYSGYGRWYGDNDAWKFLAFTAITLKILDNINEEAQREHEAAQVKATTAPVGEDITWSSGDASGSVVTTKEGVNSSGLQCREFQQTITVGGETEDAYGTACLQPDGAWEIVQ